MNRVAAEVLLVFLDNDLLVFRVISSEEGDGLLHFKCVLEALVDLPLVIALLNQDEGSGIGRKVAIVN